MEAAENPIEQELIAELVGDEPDWTAPPEPPPDQDTANARLYLMQHFDREMARVNAVADAQIEQIDAWRKKRLGILGPRRLWLEQALVRYHEALIAREPTKLSLGLPAGDLTSLALPPEWEWDEEVFIAWALEHHPDAEIVETFDPVTPPPKINKAKAKDFLTRRDKKGKPIEWGVTEGGERPPGVTVTPEQAKDRKRKFEVKPRDAEGET